MPAESPRIRPSRPEEASLLTTLAHEAKSAWGYPDEWIALWRESLTITAEDLRAHRFACAEIADEVAGVVAVSIDGDVAEIEHLWVRPACWRQGVGATLFAWAREAAANAGARTLRIASDPNAATFYERQGARRVGRIPSAPAPRTLPLLVVDL